MTARTTTVTHPDGTVSKRTSSTRIYEYAIEVGPAPAETTAASKEREADQLTARAENLRDAADTGRITIADRQLGPNCSELITHVARLAYTNLYTWCSADGRTERGHGETLTVVGVREYLATAARDSAAWLEESAAKLRNEAAAIRADGKPVGDYGVLRWSASYANAAKALPSFDYYAKQGYTLRVVPVDGEPR